MSDDLEAREGVPRRERPEIPSPEPPKRPEMPPNQPQKGPEMPAPDPPRPEIPDPTPPRGPEMPPHPPPELPPPPDEVPKIPTPEIPGQPHGPDVHPPAPGPEVPPPAERARGWAFEPPEIPVEVPRSRLAAQSRRDFLLFAAGVAASAVGAWWLLPDRAKGRLIGLANRDRLDTIAARVGLSRASREQTLDRALTFDDDVAEALYSKDRRVRTYRKSDVTALPNNYHGRTPGPEHVAGWRLSLSGLASGARESFSMDQLLARFPLREQITRLVCVEGWSAVASWGGIRLADLLAAFPPARGSRWAAMRSSISLDGAGRIEPYYVSLDLDTARHPQTLLATHFDGRPLPLAHGAPLRLLVPVKLGLKNIKALTDIDYTAEPPPDYWNERGYSKYDGL